MANPCKIWPKEHRELTIKMFTENKSPQEIADAIGRSKNAVIGWCFRQHMVFGKGRTIRVKRSLPLMVVEKEVKQKEFIDLSPFTTCQYLFGPSSDRSFCGAQVSYRSFCVCHARICYQQMDERKFQNRESHTPLELVCSK